MGAVYVARHTVTQRLSALKIMYSVDARDEEALERFLREARVSAQIGHDGIVEVFDADIDRNAGCVFIAMELLEGMSLRAMLDDERTTPKQILKLVQLMLEPLGAAHVGGFVHRDLKPENVFVVRPGTPQQKVKLLDFGIARNAKATSLTHTGTVLGTPYYMSPEHATSAKMVTPASDCWSVGVMLYEAVSGMVPFTGDTVHGVIVNACTEEHKPVQQLAPEVDPRLAQLIDDCLQKKAVGRPEDANKLAERLGELVDVASTEPKPSVPPPTLASHAPPAQIAVPMVAPDNQQARESLRMEERTLARMSRNALIIAAGGLSLALVFGIGAFATPGGGGAASPPGVIAWFSLTVALAAAAAHFVAETARGVARRIALESLPASTPKPADSAIRPVLEPLPTKGPEEALVTIVEWSSFASRSCKKLRYALVHLMERYPGQVRLVWRNAIDINDDKQLWSAAASKEALLRGGPMAFWRLHDLMFANQDKLGDLEALTELAEKAGLNRTSFEHALKTDLYVESLEAEWEMAAALDALNRPTLFVNGKKLVGAVPLEELSKVVSDQLRAAGAPKSERPSPEEAFYAATMHVRDPSAPPTSVHARQILCQYNGSKYAPNTMIRTRKQARSRAEKALERARRGMDFSDLARSLSDDPKASKTGGDLGELGRGQLPTGLEDVAFRLHQDEISEIVETEYGFHILQRYQ